MISLYYLIHTGLEDTLVESKEEIELLQKQKLSLLSVELIEREEKIQQLLEDIPGTNLIWWLPMLHHYIIGLQSQLVELRAQLEKLQPVTTTTTLIGMCHIYCTIARLLYLTMYMHLCTCIVYITVTSHTSLL